MEDRDSVTVQDQAVPICTQNYPDCHILKTFGRMAHEHEAEAETRTLLDIAMIPGEMATEGSYRTEAAVPPPSSSTAVVTTVSQESGFSDSYHSDAQFCAFNEIHSHQNQLQQTWQQQESCSSNNTASQQSSYDTGTGSLDMPPENQADVDNISMDEPGYSGNIQGESQAPYQTYDGETDAGFVMPGDVVGQQNGATSSSQAMEALGHILKMRIDLEVQQFQASLHNLLTDQHSQFQHLLRLSQKPTNQISEDPSEILAAAGQETGRSESFFCFGSTEETKEAPEDELNKYIIQLMTSASIITNTLRRKEFSLH